MRVQITCERGRFVPYSGRTAKQPQEFLDTLAIRPVQARDYPSLLAINHAGHPGVYPLTHNDLAVLLTDCPYFCVAELDGRILGYIIGYTPYDQCDGDEFAWFQAHLSDFLYIDQIAVADSARRSHVGTYLYDHAEDYARHHQLTSVVCEVNLEPPNPASLNFHIKRGFAEIGVLRGADGRTVSLRQKHV
jgi:predicted GNAT superfamily acetyltransferase